MLERRNRALLLKMTAFLVAPSRHRAHLGVQRLCPARHVPAASVHIAAARSSGPEEIDEVITRIERRAAAKQLRRFLAGASSLRPPCVMVLAAEMHLRSLTDCPC